MLSFLGTTLHAASNKARTYEALNEVVPAEHLGDAVRVGHPRLFGLSSRYPFNVQCMSLRQLLQNASFELPRLFNRNVSFQAGTAEGHIFQCHPAMYA